VVESVNADNLSDLFRTLGGSWPLFLLFFSLLTLFALLRSGGSIASRFLETCDRLFGRCRRGFDREDDRRDPRDCERHRAGNFGEGFAIGIGYFVARVPNALMFVISRPRSP